MGFIRKGFVWECLFCFHLPQEVSHLQMVLPQTDRLCDRSIFISIVVFWSWGCSSVSPASSLSSVHSSVEVSSVVSAPLLPQTSQQRRMLRSHHHPHYYLHSLLLFIRFAGRIFFCLFLGWNILFWLLESSITGSDSPITSSGISLKRIPATVCGWVKLISIVPSSWRCAFQRSRADNVVMADQHLFVLSAATWPRRSICFLPDR